MMFPVPPDEGSRLAALRELRILDTPPEAIYDDVVRLAAVLCDAPIALINFVDENRQWGKALVGLESSEAPRDASFCARTIVSADGLLVVPDTHLDPAWAGNAQVLGAPYLRFYAGAAIVDADGHALGSVCVADQRPRTIDHAALEGLRILARQTAAHLQLRRSTTLLAEANAELRRHANHDALTGLANRTLLYDRVAHALVTRLRTRRPLGLIFGDLDGFKLVNDHLGHLAGDLYLREVAARLTGVSRAQDTVARLSGDEFVVLCPEVGGEDELGRIARRYQQSVAMPLEIGGAGLSPHLSIGWALAGDDDTADNLIDRADEAMYAAKRAAVNS